VKIILILLLFLPLMGALLSALGGRWLPRRLVEITACAVIIGSTVMALIGLITTWGKSFYIVLFNWITVGSFHTAMDINYNSLAALMALMVTFVASIIHLYSIDFMRHDDDYARYFAYLNLFVFAMLVITLADNLLFFYLGWEGVGFCSYALIGFWYTDPINAAAGRKAFVTTRIGDVAFGVALAILFWHFGSFSITAIGAQTGSLTPGLATIISLLLLWAAAGKSAQLPLTVWLPDAMAGPTPVSALIHAATMVTAGVYLLMRLFPVVSLSPLAMSIIAAVGAVTTLYASLGALGQVDIKRVLAYSTISQVGYMILAVGAADIIGGMFHLLSHAFFKSLLFLSAGYVIQALDEEHNIFKMGNLRRLLPHIYWPFLIGALCLSAFPLIGGFFSKDRILLATFLQSGLDYKIYWTLAALAALLTPIYTFRMFFLAFLDRPEGRRPEDIRPVPAFMAWVIWPLAILSLFDGMLNIPFGPGKDWLGRFLSALPGSRVDLGAPVSYEIIMGVGSAILIVLTIVFSYYLYRASGPSFNFPRLQRWLYEGLYLDRFYHLVLVNPYNTMSHFIWRQIDEGVVNWSIETAAISLFRLYRKLAVFFWLDVDEGSLDRSFDKSASGVISLSGILGLWTTGKLSFYLKMFFLGLTSLFSGLALYWYFW
jgi:NADH-quinone oxidoreductase subunit L